MSNHIENGDRVPLYQRTWHFAVRIVHGFFLLMYLAALVAIAFHFPTPLAWHDLGGLVMLVIFPWFVTLVFHTRKVYGSTRGLQYNHQTTWVTVPWSKVGAVNYAWWSRNRVAQIGRMATLQVPGRKKPIYFYANDRLLVSLTRLRDAGVQAEERGSKDAEGGSAPTSRPF